MERLLLRAVKQLVPQDAKSGVALHHAGGDMPPCTGKDDGSGAHQHCVSHCVPAFPLAAVSVGLSAQTAGARFLARKRRDLRLLQIKLGKVFRR